MGAKHSKGSCYNPRLSDSGDEDDGSKNDQAYNMTIFNSSYVDELHSNNNNTAHFDTSNNFSRQGKLTLEDWLLSSPGYEVKAADIDNEDGKLYVFKHYESLLSSSKAGEGEAKETSDPREISSVSDGKLKKKVRFKLPEATDIFVFYSPVEGLEGDQRVAMKFV